jgi:arginyl-tRNA synthetase
MVAELPRTARLAGDSWEVHRIPAALLELAGEFHRWYDSHRILGIGDAGLTAARLALAEAVRGALGWGLDLLGISAPEAM